MKKRNRLIALTMSLLMSTSIVACGDPSGTSTSDSGVNKNATLIYVEHFGGGVGREWLDNAIVRFKESVKDKSYENGKTGVEFDIASSTKTDTATMSSSGRNLYIDQLSINISEYIDNGLIYEIDDVAKSVIEQKNGQDVTIEDKLIDDYEAVMKGDDGKYYILPHYEFYPGVSYDMDLFEEENLYFSNSTSGTKYECKLTGKTVYFVNSDNPQKSVGNDGKENTSDDGLPTTLEELIALCDYMKKKKDGLSAFVVSGDHLDYSHYLVHGLWTALSGYDQKQSAYTFDSNGKEVEWVSGFKSSNLFPGVTTIKEPIVEKSVINSAQDGWKTTRMLGKYYAMAFLQLAYEQKWIDDRWESDTFMHSDAMNAFVMNGVGKLPKVASIIEGSYWYNEDKRYGDLQNYEDRYKTEKNIGWLNMPTSLNVPVTNEETAREEALVNDVLSYVFINGNLKGKAEKQGVVDACKDFIKFLYTDEELRAFTGTTGVKISKVDYDCDLEEMTGLSSYQKSVLELAERTRVVQQEANNPTYKASSMMFKHNISAPGFKPEFSGRTYGTLMAAYVTGITAAECLERVAISESRWNSNYLKTN